jgi:hypothetical protein
VAAGLRAPLQALLQYHLTGAPLRTRAVRQSLQQLGDAAVPLQGSLRAPR